MTLDYPSVTIENQKLIYENGKHLDIPIVYNRWQNNKTVHEFYEKFLTKVLEENEIAFGTDPLGFNCVRYNFICYFGLLISDCGTKRNSTLRKKYSQYKFSKEYISSRIRTEYKFFNFDEFIPRNLVTQNLHEIRGLNKNISSNIDAYIQFTDEEDWESKFDAVDENIRKIYVGTRLLKFLLDKINLGRPNYFGSLIMDFSRSFVIHRSLNKVAKILSNDFKKRKVIINIDGNSYKRIKGEREMFEILIMLLLDNAIKYSRDIYSIAPTIKISDFGNGKIDISVRSYGDIIPEHERQSVFHKGFRSSINTVKTEGSGMGLFNARQLANKFGASIVYTPTIQEQASNLGWNCFTIKVNNAFDM